MYAQVNQFAAVGDIASLGTTVLTKLAQTFEQFSGDPISRFFPSETTLNSSITIERVREGVGVAPLVTPGFTDALTDNAQVERMNVFPAYVRESDNIPMNVINDLRKVGTLNEKEGKEFIAKRLRRLTNRSNHLFTMLKAQVLLGGINYTDPRTKQSINVPSGIPASNLFDVVAAGLPGFSNQANSTPVELLKRFRRKIFNVAKVEPKYIIMTSDLQTILEGNAEVLRRQEVSFLSQTGFVTFTEGKLTHIAGMEILCFDHVYQDPASSAVSKLWPINKIVLASDAHPDFAGESLGKMMYCIGEDPAGRPGLWVRSGPDSTPPAAPSRSIQIGNSGLPYLIYPDWVGIMTVDSVANLTALVDPSVTNPF